MDQAFLLLIYRTPMYKVITRKVVIVDQIDNDYHKSKRMVLDENNNPVWAGLNDIEILNDMVSWIKSWPFTPDSLKRYI